MLRGLSNSDITWYIVGLLSSKPIFCIPSLISLALIFPSLALNNSKASVISPPSELDVTLCSSTFLDCPLEGAAEGPFEPCFESDLDGAV